MPDTSTIEELIERAEKATGPDRLLDHDIAFAIGWVAAPIYHSRRSAGTYYPFDDDDDDDAPVTFNPDADNGCWTTPDGRGQTEPPPTYTATIDAALALAERMLPRWRLNLEGTLGGRAEDVYLIGPEYRSDGSRPDQSSPPISATTFPLAIILATLRALQGSMEP